MNYDDCHQYPSDYQNNSNPGAICLQEIECPRSCWTAVALNNVKSRDKKGIFAARSFTRFPSFPHHYIHWKRTLLVIDANLPWILRFIMEHRLNICTWPLAWEFFLQFDGTEKHILSIDNPRHLAAISRDYP